jgi:hypothetical protein
LKSSTVLNCWRNCNILPSSIVSKPPFAKLPAENNEQKNAEEQLDASMKILNINESVEAFVSVDDEAGFEPPFNLEYEAQMAVNGKSDVVLYDKDGGDEEHEDDPEVKEPIDTNAALNYAENLLHFVRCKDLDDSFLVSLKNITYQLSKMIIVGKIQTEMIQFFPAVVSEKEKNKNKK